MIRALAVLAAFVVASCSQAVSTSTTQSPSSASTPSAAPSPPAVSASDLVAVAALIYPAVNGEYVTCDFGFGGDTRYSHCPVTSRLNDRLLTVFTGISAPEPLGGGQDPEWTSESLTADPKGAGGVAHVVLTKPASPPSRYDLVIIRSDGKLLVDDIYCTGADPATSSIYADGWSGRYAC